MRIEVSEIARRLVRIPSVSRYESKLAAEIESILNPIRVRRQRVSDIGFNLISEYNGSDTAPVLVLNGHMDTVEPSGRWTADPYSAEVKEGKLYGLGSADMKGGLAAMIWAFKRAVRKKLPVNLVFTAVVDEEIYSHGAFELLKTLEGDMALIAEPTNEKPMLGARGRYVFDMTFGGKSAHGARPETGRNAITCASKFLINLEKLPMKADEKMGKGSAVPLKIAGGGDFLSVPERCTVMIDRHTVPGENRESVMRSMRELVDSLDMECEVSMEWHSRPTPFLEAYEFTAEEEGIRDFAELYRQEYGHFEPVYGKSVGDYNLFARKMPTVVYGPRGANWHSADEYVYIESVDRVARFYHEFIKQTGEKYA